MILSFVRPQSIEVVLEPTIRMFKSSQVERNGVLVKVTEVVDDDPREYLNSLDSSYFSVENLTAIGATDILNRKFIGDRPAAYNADLFENVKLVENVQS